MGFNRVGKISEGEFDNAESSIWCWGAGNVYLARSIGYGNCDHGERKAGLGDGIGTLDQTEEYVSAKSCAVCIESIEGIVYRNKSLRD